MTHQDRTSCAFVDKPNGECWRRGKAIELCTCHDDGHDPTWINKSRTSYWQQGCDDGYAGKPRRFPSFGGVYDLANTDYANGWDFGAKKRLAENDKRESA